MRRNFPEAIAVMAAMVLAPGLIPMMTAPAEAASVTCGNANGGGNGRGPGRGRGGGPDVDYTLTRSDAGVCGPGGNDTNSIDDGTELFGMSGWQLADKSDEDAGDGAITFQTTGSKETGFLPEGTWSISAYDRIASDVFLTLKQGPSFAAFLLTKGATTGTWDTNGGLSHASIYYQPKPEMPDTAAVPVPGSLSTGLGGLGLLAAMGYRRRRSSLA